MSGKRIRTGKLCGSFVVEPIYPLWLSLFINALKSMPDCVRLFVSLGTVEDEAVVLVTCTGCGIFPEEQTIF